MFERSVDERRRARVERGWFAGQRRRQQLCAAERRRSEGRSRDGFYQLLYIRGANERSHYARGHFIIPIQENASTGPSKVKLMESREC